MTAYCWSYLGLSLRVTSAADYGPQNPEVSTGRCGLWRTVGVPLHLNWHLLTGWRCCGVIIANSSLHHFSHPLMKVQPIHTASRQTKLKARRLCGQFNASRQLMYMVTQKNNGFWVNARRVDRHVWIYDHSLWLQLCQMLTSFQNTSTSYIYILQHRVFRPHIFEI